ncbi:cytochrome P450 [Hygrophoropsis aurantiaca]|uniref:Cytochrome P450 n=1 Tax=Hygrophoropsis aurantiaca TaxID=72124 RepID=A0ACB8AB00_9AGAM|nr:cytochrome P450 [Hygrophoropsis aurantiaca]
MAFMLVQSAAVTVLLLGLWKLSQHVTRILSSPLRALPGPKTSHWLYGNTREMYNVEKDTLSKWSKKYGGTFRYKSFFKQDALFTMDDRALNHVLTHVNDYEKPEQARYILGRILGKGVLVVEGQQHRQQRRVMNPGFGNAQIRDLTDVFFEKAIKLRDTLLSSVITDTSGEAKRVDIMPWLSRMTLDVIGLAGFNYEFNALDMNEKPNELSQAFEATVNSSEGLDRFSSLQQIFPLLRYIPTARTRNTDNARATMMRIGSRLLADAKAAVIASEGGEKIEKSSVQGRDLLSLLVRSNMATDIPESQRLSDDDVLAQVPTFLVAGHETTSTATTWALYALTQAPEVQQKLRREMLEMGTDTPSMDELMALPYLDAVVRETLRLHAPVPTVRRIAVKDDVIPLETPITDVDGNVQHEIRIVKGTPIYIPVLEISRSEAVWGADSRAFRPERWETIPEAAAHVPGVWGHLLCFLGGPRACIGFRFSLVEMKALLFTLIRSFEFELAVPVNDIGSIAKIVQVPFVRSEPEKQSQMPLLIKPYQAS